MRSAPNVSGSSLFELLQDTLEYMYSERRKIMMWYMQNGLQLNPDKSEELMSGTANQLHTVSSTVTSVSVAVVALPVANQMEVLGVVLDQRLTFKKQVIVVARSCNYHAQAIRHIRHLLTTELATTLACSLILNRLDYCNLLLHGAPTSSIRKLQRVQNNTATIILQALRRSDAWTLLRHKLTVMTYKVRTTAIPTYLSRHLTLRQPARTLRASDVPLLIKPFTRKRAFRHSAPTVWNSLPRSITNCDSLQCLNVD